MRVFILIGAIALGGCMNGHGASQPETVSAAAQPGQEIYTSFCVACHGEGARGDGALASDLPVRPADLTQLSARNGGVFPTSDVMAKIYGYPGRYQDHVMPEFGPVLEGRKVVWTDETGTQIETPQALLDLTTYLRSLQQL